MRGLLNVVSKRIADRKSSLSRRMPAAPATQRCGPSLRIESLEKRQMLSITVDTALDEADGRILDGDVSLRVRS